MFFKIQTQTVIVKTVRVSNGLHGETGLFLLMNYASAACFHHE